MSMKKRRIAYLTLAEGEWARRYPWSSWQLESLCMEFGGGSLLYGRVPEYERRGRSWKQEQLKEQLQNTLMEWECRDYYLHPALRRFLKMEEKLPPALLLEQVFDWIGCWEYLCYRAPDENLWGEEEKVFAILEEYLPRINHVTLLTDEEENYESFISYIYEAYGIPSICLQGAWTGPGRAGRTVILDGRKGPMPDWKLLPRDAAYLDLWSEKEKEDCLRKIRPDISYRSVANFLDTVIKNGYNTLVN